MECQHQWTLRHFEKLQECVRPAECQESVKGKSRIQNLCLTFERVLPKRVYLDYVCSRVRPYEKAPFRCLCGQEYGHVTAVCRGVRRCGSCGKGDCDKKCKDEDKLVKRLHCEGDRHVGLAKCPKRIKEMQVNEIRVP